MSTRSVIQSHPVYPHESTLMTAIGRRTFIKAVGAAASFSPYTTSAIDIAADPPNILFILADDMGYGDISYLNAESKIPTPNIDRIGREGEILQ